MTMKYKNMTWGRMEAVLNIVTSAGGESAIDDLLAGKLKVVKVQEQRPTFKVTVNYDQTLEEMIKLGKFDYVCDKIDQKNFPIESIGRQDVEIVLFYFEKTMASKEIIEEMKKEGYRPTNIIELLSLAIQEPDLQRNFGILGLGSVWQWPSGVCFIPHLCDASYYKRVLNLFFFETTWPSGFRFAAVRESFNS